MAINNYLHSKQSKIFVILAMLFLLTGCNILPSRGPVWLGEPVITSGLDDNGDPIDSMENFEAGVKVVYCYLSIKGPEGFKLYVRWYNEDTLIIEQFVDFGTEQKFASDLRFEGNKPLPTGNYRCEFGLQKEKPLKSIHFNINN